MASQAQSMLMFGGGVDGDWTPADLGTSPAGWWGLDSTVTDVSGACSKITDVSGNTLDLVQTTSGERPTINATGLNGQRTLTFDGTNDNLTKDTGRVGGTTAYGAIFRNKSFGWALFVSKRSSLSGGDRRVFSTFVSGSGSARFEATLCRTGGTADVPILAVRRLDNDSTTTLEDSAAPDTGWHIWLMVMDWANGDGFVYRDGEQRSSNTSLTTTGSTSDTQGQNNDMAIGSRADGAANYANMEWAELVVGNASISGTEIDKLFGWAAHRWGLEANLPSAHPYRYFAP